MIETSGLFRTIESRYSFKISSFKIHSGYVNTVYELITSGDRTYYVRGYPQDDVVLKQKNVNESNMLNFFRDQASKVYLDFILKGKNGEQTLSYKNQIFTVREKLPGQPSNHGLINSRKRHSAGRLLGHFHNTLSRFPEGQWNHYDYSKYFLPIIFHLKETDLILLVERATKFSLEHESPATEIWRLKNKEAMRFIKHYCRLRGKMGLKSQVIHGDLDPTNVTFEGDRAVGFMDWDFLQFSPRILDIANSMINRPAYTREDPQFNFNLKEVNEFLDGYQDTAEQKLSSTEIKSIPCAFYNMGLQYLLTASFLFSKDLPEKKLADFLAFRFVFLETLEDLGDDWYIKISA